MNNKIALCLGLTIIAVIILDYVISGSDHLVFLGKKFAAVLDWMAFWR